MDKSESITKITEAELEIMSALWEADKPLNITELKNLICQKKQWSGDTVKTLLRRLCNKGVVGQEKRQVFYYYPLISAAEYGRYSTQRIIDKLYSGSAQQLVVTLVQNEQLSPEDISALRALLLKEDKKE